MTDRESLIRRIAENRYDLRMQQKGWRPYDGEKEDWQEATRIADETIKELMSEGKR